MTPDEAKARFGDPPSPTMVVWNPKYDQWIERLSIWLCADEHEAAAIPCDDHIHAARKIGNDLVPGMAIPK